VTPETSAQVSKYSGRRCGPTSSPYHSRDSGRSVRTEASFDDVHRSEFYREKGKKLRPRHISDRTVQTSVRVHFIHGAVFHESPSVLIHDLRRFLMHKVGALDGNAFMNFWHNLFTLILSGDPFSTSSTLLCAWTSLLAEYFKNFGFQISDPSERE